MKTLAAALLLGASTLFMSGAMGAPAPSDSHRVATVGTATCELDNSGFWCYDDQAAIDITGSWGAPGRLVVDAYDLLLVLDAAGIDTADCSADAGQRFHCPAGVTGSIDSAGLVDMSVADFASLLILAGEPA